MARNVRFDVNHALSVNGNCSKGIFTRKSPFSRPRLFEKTGQQQKLAKKLAFLV
jgi:hypothetical protein